MADVLCSSFKGLSIRTARTSSFALGSQLALSAKTVRVTRRECQDVEAAHKKGAGSTKNGRDSISKRRGIKIYGMQRVKAGGIIVRQLGTKFHPGNNVGLGKDYTLFAKQAGIVMFESGKKKGTKKVSVYPADHPTVLAKTPPKPENGRPSCRERRLQRYRPRAELRAEIEAQIVNAVTAPIDGSPEN